jgi:hypothetical protein
LKPDAIPIPGPQKGGRGVPWCPTRKPPPATQPVRCLGATDQIGCSGNHAHQANFNAVIGSLDPSGPIKQRHFQPLDFQKASASDSAAIGGKML